MKNYYINFKLKASKLGDKTIKMEKEAKKIKIN